MKTLLLALLCSFSSLAATIVPFEREVSRIPKASFITSNNHESVFYSQIFLGDAEDNLYFHGFSLMNNGTNDIVPTTVTDYDFAYRNFDFVTDDHSQRDTFLWMTDYIGSGLTSDMFETAMVFLPRENQMHVEETTDELIVTLVTGEEVIYAKDSRKIKSGVLTERAVDFNPDRSARKFADVSYSGKGLVIRSDAKAADPRLAKNVQILKAGFKPCVVAGKNFWTQEGFPKFKFITDDEAYKKISELCGEEYIK